MGEMVLELSIFEERHENAFNFHGIVGGGIGSLAIWFLIAVAFSKLG